MIFAWTVHLRGPPQGGRRSTIQRTSLSAPTPNSINTCRKYLLSLVTPERRRAIFKHYRNQASTLPSKEQKDRATMRGSHQEAQHTSQ